MLMQRAVRRQRLTRVFELFLISLLLIPLAMALIPRGDVQPQSKPQSQSDLVNSQVSQSNSATTSQDNQSQLTVTSQDNFGDPIIGHYVSLFLGGVVISNGFTPVNFSLVDGQSYVLEMANHGPCNFSTWADTGVTNASRAISLSGNLVLAAVYDCGGVSMTSGEVGGEPGTITLYDHRVPQSDWAPCFALVCNAGTGPGVGMYAVLYDPAGTVVATGFSSENGYTFTGLNASATYYLYPQDCDDCHGSTHDVLFDHWGSGNTTRPLALFANGTFVDAWFVCTNGCGGGY